MIPRSLSGPDFLLETLWEALTGAYRPCAGDHSMWWSVKLSLSQVVLFTVKVVILVVDIIMGLGRQDNSLVRTLATKHDHLSSFSGTYVVEGEPALAKLFFGLHMLTMVYSLCSLSH